jgi:predicted enzyme related to lactoylglutathione lyase
VIAETPAEEEQVMALADASPVGFIPAAAFDRARGFYEGVLGLTVESADDFGVQFSLANGAILRIVKPPEFTPFAFTLFGFAVTDITAEVRALAAKGVVFERFMPTQDDDGVWTAPGGSKVAWFKDLDGNLLSLSQHSR